MWVILEGLDRTGKSTVSEYYKRRGFEVVHMSAPAKKYLQPGYSGPSYLDEMLDVYMQYTGKDVIFDRSPYGETVWPFVYGRKPQLDDEAIEILQDLENQNEVERILMFDQNVEAHWKRCVDNNEPLTRPQFNQANVLFDKMARKYSFTKKQLSDYNELQKAVTTGVAPQQANMLQVDPPPPVPDHITVQGPGPDGKMTTITYSNNVNPELNKLEQANAIKDVLSKGILKKKGPAYDQLEADIRSFLQEKLSTIFGNTKPSAFTDEETQILKLYCKQLKQKLEARK